MNIVDSITRQIPMGSLSSFLGTSELSARGAVGAAAPALFSAISKLAPSKLMPALAAFDADSVDRLITKSPEAVADQGLGLADSLLGGPTTSDLAGSVSRAAGIGVGTVSKLISYLLPLLLGGIAKKFAGRALTPQSLGALFSERKPEFPRVPRGTGRWAIGAIVALAALGLFWAASRMRVPAPQPRVVDVDTLGREADGALSSLTSTLSGIQDEATAQASLHSVRQLTSKIGALRDRVPEGERERFDDLIRPRIPALEEQTARVGEIPGAESIKPELDVLVARLRTTTPADVR